MFQIRQILNKDKFFQPEMLCKKKGLFVAKIYQNPRCAMDSAETSASQRNNLRNMATQRIALVASIDEFG